MDRPIARRDFLDGVALAIGVTAGAAAGGALLPGLALGDEAAPQDRPDYYPPLLTGLRGSHPGSFEAAHALRDGMLKIPDEAPGTVEDYDLVVVGGGISGLAAAHFYRAARPDARILILENHDDFGGHAKRNEFRLRERLHLMNGGTLEIDSPRPYSVVASGLLRTLGIDPVALEKQCADDKFYPSQGLGVGLFFDKETFGADKLVTGAGQKPWREVLAGAPLSPKVREDIARIEEDSVDYMPGLGSDEKKARLARMSYEDYLVKVIKADPGVVPYYRARTHGEWGVGTDAVGALEVWPFGFPGFKGLGLKPGAAPHMGYTAAGYAEGGSAKFHFPDGNASIARLLVRKLVPEAIPGSTAEDVVTARADYTKLDRPGAPVRIRLSSTAVRVRNRGNPSGGVEIVYSRAGRLAAVRGRDCVLACYNMIIPYLCPELPERQ